MDPGASPRSALQEQIQIHHNTARMRYVVPNNRHHSAPPDDRVSRAASREARRRDRKDTKIDEIQRCRFNTMACMGVIVGRGTVAGPGLLNFPVCMMVDNMGFVNTYRMTYGDEKTNGPWVYVADKHIEYEIDMPRQKEAFVAESHGLAMFLREQARALTFCEQGGFISTAQAVMASRHRGAWTQCLRIAKYHNLYQGDELDSLDADANLAAAEALFQAWTRAYSNYKFPRIACAHAAAFYLAHQTEFGESFNPALHLDFFFHYYTSQVFRHRHKSPWLDDTIDKVDHNTMIQDFTAVLRKELADPAGELALFHQQVMKPEHVVTLRELDRVAKEDAMEDATPMADLQELDGFILTAASLPEDWSHMEKDYYHADLEWYSHFFGHHEHPPTLPLNRIPKVVFRVTGPGSSPEIVQALIQYQRDFEEWSDDVLAWLVWDQVVHAAIKGDLPTMRRLHDDVEWMMDGKVLGKLFHSG